VDNLFAGIHCSVEDTVSPQHMSRESIYFNTKADRRNSQINLEKVKDLTLFE